VSFGTTHSRCSSRVSVCLFPQAVIVATDTTGSPCYRQARDGSPQKLLGDCPLGWVPRPELNFSITGGTILGTDTMFWVMSSCRIWGHQP
jgi:hypothetical protein